VFTGGFVGAGGAGGDDANNTGNTDELEIHQCEQRTHRSAPTECRPEVADDCDRKSRDYVGDDDVTQSPRESLS